MVRLKDKRYKSILLNDKSLSLITMVVFSAAVASLGAYLLLTTATHALPTARRQYANGHGPSVALYDALSQGNFTGDVTKCNGESAFRRWFLDAYANHLAGYSVKSVDTSATGGILASLALNGEGCKAFGNDISTLVVSVEYETKQRK